MPLTTCVAAYQVCVGDFLYSIFLVGLGIDGAVIADGIDLLALPSNLGDSVTLSLLELLNELLHDIEEDDLRDESLANTPHRQPEGFTLPHSPTDTASRQQSRGQCSHLRSEQL